MLGTEKYSTSLSPVSSRSLEGDATSTTIALDPGYCAAHRALGVVHATRQDARRSVEAYQRYLQCSPRVADDTEIQRRITAFGGSASVAGDPQR